MPLNIGIFHNNIITVKAPYDDLDLQILTANIWDMPFTVEETYCCEDIDINGEIKSLFFPEHMVEFQEEYMKIVKHLKVADLLKNSDLSKDKRHLILDYLYRKANKKFQEEKKRNSK